MHTHVQHCWGVQGATVIVKAYVTVECFFKEWASEHRQKAEGERVESGGSDERRK